MKRFRFLRYVLVGVLVLSFAGCIPIVKITSPQRGATFGFGDLITFTGTGRDFMEGDLTGAALVWESNIDGQIGTGETFSINNLSPGIHTITLSATNSNDQTGTAKVTITVGEPPIVMISDDIDSNTTWESENIYLVTQRIDVNAVLTIEAGTVVKFEPGVYIDVETGKIIAEGALGNPIVFTSYRDDVYGGDTNLDGNDTLPAPGDWAYLSIGGTNNDSVFDYCEFYYGGGYSGYEYTLELRSSNTTVSNCTFAHNVGEEYGVLDAHDAGEGTSITGNTFEDNVVPMSISGMIDIDDSNTFGSNTQNGIFYESPFGDIEGNRTWEETEVPFVVCDGTYDLDIPAGTSLTLGEGVTVKFCERRGVRAQGGLIIAQGSDTNPIAFTSYRDDVNGGDTNGDGSMTSPAAGDWTYISITGTNNTSIFDYCEFYYGGGDRVTQYTLELRSSNTTVSNCTFAHNVGEEYGVLDAHDAGEGTSITGNTFEDNVVPMSISGMIDIDDSNTFGSNTQNGIFYESPFGDIEGNRTWEETEVPFVVCDGTYDLDIPAGTSLTLGDGVVLKFCSNRGIRFQGNNISNFDGTGVWYTSYKNDSRLGDTNGDGSITSPAVGDWDGIYDDVGGTYVAWPNMEYNLN